MSVFADSSALVKLYADEFGHEDVRRLREPFVVSQLARVEVPSALWRKQRTGELTPEDASLLTEAFEADWFGTQDEASRFLVICPIAPILDDAARLVAIHGLRAYDGIQLASALAAAEADPACRTFAAFDHPLRSAAAAEGLSLAPVPMSQPGGLAGVR